MKSKTKANRDLLAHISSSSSELHVITSSFDWLTVLSVSFVINDFFGFAFTTPSWKPL